MNKSDLVVSTFQDKPAYRYIRKADKLPTYDEIPRDKPFAEIMCPVKLFNPTGIGTWWIAAYDPDDRIAWGVAELTEAEVGSFSMDELIALRGRPFGLPIERDIYYTPISLEEAQKGRR